MKLNFYLLISTNDGEELSIYLDTQKFEHDKIYNMIWVNNLEKRIDGTFSLTVIMESDGEPFFTIFRPMRYATSLPKETLNIRYTCEVKDELESLRTANE